MPYSVSFFLFIDIIALGLFFFFVSLSSYVAHTVHTIIVYSRLSRAHLPHFLLVGFFFVYALRGLFVEIIFQLMPFSLPSLAFTSSFTLFIFIFICCCCCRCCWRNIVVVVFFYCCICLRFQHAIEKMFMRIFSMYTNMGCSLWTKILIESKHSGDDTLVMAFRFSIRCVPSSLIQCTQYSSLNRDFNKMKINRKSFTGCLVYVCVCIHFFFLVFVSVASLVPQTNQYRFCYEILNISFSIFVFRFVTFYRESRIWLTATTNIKKK